jgi:hypothetical protein
MNRRVNLEIENVDTDELREYAGLERWLLRCAVVA